MNSVVVNLSRNEAMGAKAARSKVTIMTLNGDKCIDWQLIFIVVLFALCGSIAWNIGILWRILRIQWNWLQTD